MVRLNGTVYMHTVEENSKKVVEKSGADTKAEMNGLEGAKYSSLDLETVCVKGAATVVDKKAVTVCPNGK